jgi:hypothetical protein
MLLAARQLALHVCNGRTAVGATKNAAATLKLTAADPAAIAEVRY